VPSNTQQISNSNNRLLIVYLFHFFRFRLPASK